jgi:prepilin-type N-terminal cleavage/methylation domain-containing protein
MRDAPANHVRISQFERTFQVCNLGSAVGERSGRNPRDWYASCNESAKMQRSLFLHREHAVRARLLGHTPWPGPGRHRGFTLTELMVVVLIISITAGLAMPIMLSGRHERRAFGAAADIANIIREARSRAMGRGAAQLVKLEFGAGGAGTRGRFTMLENADQATLEPRADGCKLTDWSALAGTSSVKIREFSLDGGVDVDADITTSQISGGVTSTQTVYLCFTPNGRLYYAQNLLANLRTAAALPTELTFQVIRTTGGPVRQVVVLPSGVTRLAAQ